MFVRAIPLGEAVNTRRMGVEASRGRAMILIVIYSGEKCLRFRVMSALQRAGRTMASRSGMEVSGTCTFLMAEACPLQSHPTNQ
jgi:hypothetical protein